MDRTDNAAPEKLRAYYKVMELKGLCRNQDKLRHQMDFIYRDCDFSGKTVLDIGGGNGIHSFYAAACGAKQVVCLEPEAAGSTEGVIAKFRELGELLECPNTTIVPTTFQDYDPGDSTFDVVMLQDSVNHLDEECCVKLLHDAEAQATYREVFEKIGRVSHDRTELIVCDCSRYNLYPALGMSNPADPGIEWEKHQAPEFWAKMLREVGYGSPRVRWSTPSRFGGWGRIVFGNKLMAYFFTSHFCLTMQRRTA
jgi:SAM-dependent methyltransferase